MQAVHKYQHILKLKQHGILIGNKRFTKLRSPVTKIVESDNIPA